MISVVICTYNRADLLASCLRCITCLSSPEESYEVLIVDNNSTDSTQEIAGHFSSEKPNIRLLTEFRQGLSHARNRGWKEARGEYVAYIDDDCRVPVGWLTKAHEVIERGHPSVFGGPFYPFYLSMKPKWYNDKYGSYSIGENARRLTGKEFLFGGNIFFKKTILELLGGFSPKLGMKGKSLAYGEEIALQKKLYERFPNEIVYYDPDLYLFHLVRKEKMYWRWIIKHRFITRRYAYRVNSGYQNNDMRQGKYLIKIIAIISRLIMETGAGLVKRDRTQYPYYQNFLFEYALQNIDRLGWLYEKYRCRK